MVPHFNQTIFNILQNNAPVVQNILGKKLILNNTGLKS